MKGIYLITNNINGKRYVGLSNNVRRRFLEHRTPKNLKSKTTVLARAFRKHGIENFSFILLEAVKNITELADKEQEWIKTLNPEYNMNEGGLGNKGFTLSEEAKAVLRNHGKIQWNNKTDEEKRKIVKNNLKGPSFGHAVLPDTIEKLRASNIGKVQKEETKAKRAEKNRIAMKGNTNGNKEVVKFLNGVQLETYTSINTAAQACGIHNSSISGVLINRQKTAGGFNWKYSN